MKQATFIELHKAQARVLRALKELSPEDRKRVLDAVVALTGAREQESSPPSSGTR